MLHIISPQASTKSAKQQDGCSEVLITFCDLEYSMNPYLKQVEEISAIFEYEITPRVIQDLCPHCVKKMSRCRKVDNIEVKEKP